MKHTKILFKHYLTVWSNLLIESELQADAGTWLLTHNARTPLFYLEAITRVLSALHNKKTMTKLNERFKLLEDGLGKMDHYTSLIKDFQGNPQIPIKVKQHLHNLYQLEISNFNTLLHEQGWLGDKAKRGYKIKQQIKDIDWLNDNKFKNELQKLYQDQIAKITQRLEQPFVDIEADIHELRRDVRWLSIYPQAFKGFVTLKSSPSIAVKWNKYLTPEVVRSPFNQLPQVDDITDTLALHAQNFYAMSWLIAALGILKDHGLRLNSLANIWREMHNITPNHAQELALQALGSSQASIPELLAAMRVLAAHAKKDLIFSGLLVNY